VRVRVPAKINLHLGVGPRRPDGFHELMTAFHAVALFDTVTLIPAPTMAVRVTGEHAGEVPTDDRNLAWRAAQAILGSGPDHQAVSIRIDKAIPVAAGLAGGSADGAAALIGADALSGHRRTRAELTALAAALGSDVAFALRGGTAIGTGRGEVLSPVLEVPDRLYWVLALADGGLSTPAVYAEFDRRQAAGLDDPAGLTPPTDLLHALRDGNPAAVGAALANDLQPAALALAPNLQDTLDAGMKLGALGSVIAGSGPTCVFLAADAADASRLATALIKAKVCRTTRVASGPAVGAQLC
jgi:4-diphosphocytidyl-2-C-methyl-D-erythritol kinase